MTPGDSPDVVIAIRPSRALSLRGVAGALSRSGVARLSAASYVTLLFGVVTGPLSSRAIGPNGRGQAAAILNFVLLATTILSLGVGPAVGHLLTNAKATEEQALGAACRFALYILPASALVAAAFYFAGVTQALGSSARAIGAAMILMAPLYPVGQAIEFILLSRGDLHRLATIRLRSFSVYSLSIVAFFVMGNLTTSWFVGLTAVQGMISLGISARSIGHRVAPGIRILPLLRYGARQLGGHLMSFANFRADQLLLVPFLGFGEIGIYAVAVTVATFPMGLAAAVSLRVLSNSGTAKAFRADNAGEALRRVLLLTGAACLVLAIAAPALLPLAYGRDFQKAAAVLLLLLPGTLALAGASTAEQLMTVLGRPGTQTLTEMAALVVNALLLVALVPDHGIHGAAAASSIAYWVRFSLLLRSLRGVGISSRAVVPRVSDIGSLARRFTHR